MQFNTQFESFHGKSALFDSMVYYPHGSEIDVYGKIFKMKRFEYTLSVPYQVPHDKDADYVEYVRNQVDEHVKLEIVKQTISSILFDCKPRAFSQIAYQSASVKERLDDFRANYTWYVSPESYQEIIRDYGFNPDNNTYRGIPLIVDNFINHGIFETISGSSFVHKFKVEKTETELKNLGALIYERKYSFLFQGFVFHVPTYGRNIYLY